MTNDFFPRTSGLIFSLLTGENVPPNNGLKIFLITAAAITAALIILLIVAKLLKQSKYRKKAGPTVEKGKIFVSTDDLMKLLRREEPCHVKDIFKKETF